MFKMEDAGIDPASSRMESARSTIWANPPFSDNSNKHIAVWKIKQNISFYMKVLKRRRT